jgi:hypothetical protein
VCIRKRMGLELTRQGVLPAGTRPQPLARPPRVRHKPHEPRSPSSEHWLIHEKSIGLCGIIRKRLAARGHAVD